MKKIILLTSIITSFSFCASAQTQAELMLQAKTLLKTLNETEAYPILVKAVKVNNTSLEALTMSAFYADKEGNRQTNNKKRDDYYKASKIFAEAALRQYPNEAEANYVMGVALGRIALISSSKEKIKLSKEIKLLGEKCIQLNPNHAGGYHLLGKWHYEVYNLNFAEKAAVNLLFGGLPAANINTSCTFLQKAIQLNPTYLLYYLDAAKALHEIKKDADAIALLNKMLLLKPTTQDDKDYIVEAKELIKKWE
jgi:tetratricopeptide (TPR) repeat protein